MAILDEKEKKHTFIDTGFNRLLIRASESEKKTTEIDLPPNIKHVFSHGLSQGLLGSQALGANISLGHQVIAVLPIDNIQEVIETLHSRGGGIIKFGPHTYYLSYTLTVRDNISFIGEGRDVTIIDFMKTSNNFTVKGTLADILNNNIFRDFTVQNSTSTAAIDIDYADFLRMQNVKSTSNGGKGIRIDHSRFFNLTDIDAAGNAGNGIEIRGDDTIRTTSNAVLLNCECDSNSGIGISIVDTGGGGVKDMNFIDCRTNGNSGDGVDATQTITGTDRLSFIGCLAGSNGGKGFDINIQGTNMTECFSVLNTGDGFEMSQVQFKLIGCTSASNSGVDYDIQASGVFVGNTYPFSTTTDPSARTSITDPLINLQFYGNQGTTFKQEVRSFRMLNASGGARTIGDVVILKAVADGDEVTTTTTQGDDKVFGMVTETSLADAAWGGVLTQGFTTRLKVDGTTDIAIGDLLGTFTTAGIAMKAAAGDMAFAIALEAYTTNDSSGVIDAILITPRLI